MCAVRINGLGPSGAAASFYCDRHAISRRAEAYDVENIAGLGDRPRSGRPTKVGLGEVEKIPKENGGEWPRCGYAPDAKGSGQSTP